MLWIGRGFLVIRPNFGGDIQLYMNGMKGFFFASARIRRWAAGPRTDGWIVLVDASSGAMLSAFVPV